MASQPPPSNFPTSMGPGARPVQPGEPGSILKELQDIRASYTINVDSDALRLGYNYRGQNRKYDIPFTSMPITDSSRWLLYGGPGRAKVTGLLTLDLIRGAENMAGRPLTQSEADGFAFHAGKKMKYNFLGTVAGLTVGYTIAARTWKTMKFPFMKVKPIESYDYFPTQRLALVKGNYSRLLWQINRANIYAAICLIFAQTVLGSFGDTVMTVGLYRDTRTQEVVKAMKGGFDRIRINRSQPGQTPPSPQQQQGHDEDPSTEDFYGNEGKGIQDYYGKSGIYSGEQTFSSSAADTNAMDEANTRQRERQLEKAQDPYSQPTQSSTPSRKQDSGYFFDDASPVAGNDASMATPRSSQSNSGSTWDRIRRGGRSQPQSPPKPQPQDTGKPVTSPGGWRGQSPQNFENSADSFSFSNTEEERQLAKYQAQKDFDAMLEKERRQGGSEGYANSSFAAESGSETPQQTGGSAWDRRRRGGS